MIKNFTSLLVGFALALLLSPPVFPQLNVVVKHKAPAYVTPTFIDSTFVAQSGTTLGAITSPALTLTSGDFIYVSCRYFGVGSSTASSTPSNTFTAGFTSQDSSGAYTAFYAFSVAGGSTTFTCTPASPAPFNAMVVRHYQGTITSLDVITGNISGSTSSTATTPSFSTSARGLIIICVLGSNAPNNFSLGTIGSGSATNLTSDTGTANGSLGCEDSIASTSQTTITGTMGIGPSSQWITNVLAVK